ncbi:hypothetical protein MA16_Dca027321 [Dendrobium catenatum]|uniref:Uncharacterized protein n=1 Tax=Dendrobium catenatum TaxID=906689 RepID=A0A2I0X9U8_9ASPA|nr:hypothetical protein MA16_Dca027321 [Dendrobium catenatum]
MAETTEQTLFLSFLLEAEGKSIHALASGVLVLGRSIFPCPNTSAVRLQKLSHGAGRSSRRLCSASEALARRTKLVFVFSLRNSGSAQEALARLFASAQEVMVIRERAMGLVKGSFSFRKGIKKKGHPSMKNFWLRHLSEFSRLFSWFHYQLLFSILKI